MTDLPRLANDEDAPGAALLRAARGDAPPKEVLSRTLLAVGAGAAASTLTAAAAAKTAKTGAGMLAKYLLVGFASGVVAVGGGAALHHAATTGARTKESHEAPAARSLNAGATTQAPAAVAATIPNEDVPERLPVASSPVPPARATEGPASRDAAAIADRPAPSASSPSHRDEAMELEVRLLDEARQHVAAGRGREALDALGRYSRDVKQPRLAPEAWYLQMEAHQVRGDRAAAVRAAEALLQRYPSGPHALRARRIIDGS